MVEKFAHSTSRQNEQAVETGENPSRLIHLVTFGAGGQAYALPVESILQIIPMLTITPMPMANGLAQLGVINVRGRIIPVADMRCHLGLPAPRRLYTPIILISAGSKRLGLVVDEVLDVIELPADRLVSLGTIFLDGCGQSPVLRGMAHLADRIVPVLSVNSLFRALLSGEPVDSTAALNSPVIDNSSPYGPPTVPQVLAEQPAPLPLEAPAQQPDI